MPQRSVQLIVFGLFVGLLFGAEVAAWLGGGLALARAGWFLCAVFVMLLAAVGTLLMDRLVLKPMQLREAALAGELRERAAELRDRAEGRRQLRHDLRGALSPALLMVDRLLSSSDPSIRRAGEMTLRAVERASALLLEGDDEGQDKS